MKATKRSTLKRAVQKGFTLIELAVVIAVVAILAAVAVPRLTTTTGGANLAVATDLLTQLRQGINIFTVSSGAAPTGFTDFAYNGGTPTANQHLNLQRVAGGTCTVGATSIACTFSAGNAVTFTLANGDVTATGTGQMSAISSR